MEHNRENQEHVITVSLVYGRDLSVEDLNIINTQRSLEFDAELQIRPEPENEDWNKPYFLVRHTGKLVAFGRLHSIQVEFQGVASTILGIATIIAVQKGEGYGKMLMGRMKEYIQEKGMTAIGFCKPTVAGFYEKCGYSILPKGARRFTFLGANQQPIEISGQDKDMVDMLYISGREGLIETLQASERQRIVAYRAKW